MEKNWNEPQIDLPNATLILVLGIISIAGCCCAYGTIGVICGIIALVLAKTSTSLYVTDPQKYTESSYKNINTGKNMRMGRINPLCPVSFTDGIPYRHFRLCRIDGSAGHLRLFRCTGALLDKIISIHFDLMKEV